MMFVPDFLQSASLAFAIVGLAFVAGRTLVLQNARRSGRHLASLAGYYSWYCGLGALLPTLLFVLIGWFLSVPVLALRIGMPLIAGLSAVYLLFRVSPGWPAQFHVERMVRLLLLGCAGVVVLTSLGIVLSLIFETSRFFASDGVSVREFFTGTEWSAQTQSSFGALPLFFGTFFIAFIAICIAAPIGLFSAIYLSEYASPLSRRIMKPFLEILAGVPTVVYGFFALLVVGPIVHDLGNAINALAHPFTDGQDILESRPRSALAAGAVMGVMIIPFISSLADDVMRSVPARLRNAALGVGATKSEALKHIILPAAFPGLMAALLLAVSRAIGETMIVVMAAGDRAQITLNPFEDMSTVTVQIVSLLVGDTEFDNPRTLSAFALGAVLFFVTLLANMLGQWIVDRQRKRYAGT